VKLFDNAISFAVPILKSEVRFVDQVLVEALRVFYPTVYDAIRRNPSDVLKNRRNRYLESPPPPSPVDEAIASLAADESERKAVTELVRELFPRPGSMEYGNDWNTSWAQEKRICSDDYFHRYFTHGVPTGYISDEQIERLLGLAGDADEDGTRAILRDAYERGAAEILIRKLRHREETFDLEIAPVLIAAIAKCASEVPVGHDLMFGTFTRSQAAILICKIVSRMGVLDQDKMIGSAVEYADSLPFICELIQFSRLKETRGEERGFLPPERVHPLVATLLSRLSAKADESGANLAVAAGTDFGSLAYSIIAWGSDATKTELRRRLATILDSDPHNSLVLLKALAGKSQASDGVVRIADFTGETYKSVGELLEPDRVFEQLREIYGERIDHAEWSDDWDDTKDVDQRIANQFAAIHRARDRQEDV
jgi:hypothetical protein